MAVNSLIPQALETKFVLEAFNTRCTSLFPWPLPPLVAAVGYRNNQTPEAAKAWEQVRFCCTHHKTKKCIQPSSLGCMFGMHGYISAFAIILQCLKTVFPIPGGVKFLALPGDNDIGGEGTDAMDEEVNRCIVATNVLTLLSLKNERMLMWFYDMSA